MAYEASDFEPMPVGNNNECGCEHHGYLCPCHIYYVDDEKHCHHVCFRQQCQECGFVRKNKIGRTLYYDIIDSTSKKDRFVFLPEYFTVLEEFCFDENKQYSKKKKLDFLRRILTLANQDKEHFGHLYFTREEIYNLKIA